MALAPPPQGGLPASLPGLVGLAGIVVLLLLLLALGGVAYRAMTGGIEWPGDAPEDDESVRRGGEDDEWDYY